MHCLSEETQDFVRRVEQDKARAYRAVKRELQHSQEELLSKKAERDKIDKEIKELELRIIRASEACADLAIREFCSNTRNF